ncbi:MAG: MgtC/SapB family protein [Planctomycetaceae bacterium]|nr:MgtC/SapB family protein [Planctomycetaceae bacterium]
MGGDFASLTDAVALDFADFRRLDRLGQVAVRLVIAALLGGLLGYQRELAGKDAGLRTYMLVAVAAAFFIMVPQQEGWGTSDMSRVVQGLLAGIGFLGGGAILKVTAEKEIHGLTTATGIWMTSAVGFGRIGTAVLGAILTFLILSALGRVEATLIKPHRSD